MSECVKTLMWATTSWGEVALMGHLLLSMAIGHLWLLINLILRPVEWLMERAGDRYQARKREKRRIQRIGEHRKWLDDHATDLNKTPRSID
jgi:hypothetical protein